jgi:hypothetical protein
LAEAPDPRIPDGVSTDLVEYLIVVVPQVQSLTSVAGALATLIRSGTIDLLDVVVIVKEVDSSVRVLEIEAVDSLAALRDVEGEFGGLLSEHDIELASFAIRPGSAGIVLVTEDRWAEPLSTAARYAGGHIIAGERIPASRVEAALADRAGNERGVDGP